MQDIDEAIAEMVTAYHAFNTSIDEHFQVEANRYVFEHYIPRNKPCVFRKGIVEWPAFKLWNASYLRNKMGKRPVKIAETPDG